MKNFKVLLLFISLAICISCDKDNDDISLSSAEAQKLNVIVQQGDWKISSFIINDSDDTANYADYLFSFEDANSLKAQSATDQMNGTWRISNDAGSEYDSYNDVDFNIFFSADSKFGVLTNNYDVISASEQEIKLNLQDNPNGNTALLTFSRN